MNSTSRLRRRKSHQPSPVAIITPSIGTGVKPKKNISWFSFVFYYTFIACLSILSGVLYSKYLKLLHENNLWFSNLQAVEREISFRTESGFYYSYFKKLSTGQSVYENFISLLADDRTEAWRSINALKRFNIYQEVFLATIYRMFALDQSDYERIYFYIDSVFSLHGIYLTILFTITFIASGKLTASILSIVFFVLNRENATRVEFSVPLRESFAIPFIYLHILVTCIYLKNSNRIIILPVIYSVTVIFCLFWQFSQFVLMLISFAYVTLYTLELITAKSTTNLLITTLLALLTTFIVQFGNMMLLSSFGLHFIWISILSIKIKKNLSDVMRLASIGFILVILLASAGASMLVKAFFSINDDNHIYKFALHRLMSLNNEHRDFETGLYLCHSGFEGLSLEIVKKLTLKTYLLPIYVLAIFYYTSQSAFQWYNRVHLINSELVFITILSILFGFLSSLAVRMQYLWTPSMCLLASILITDNSIYSAFLSRSLQVSVRRLFTIAFICLVCLKNFESFRREVNDLREFHDPHTVELIGWINSKTNPDEVFSGTMQLMASVKCCTDRRLTNHPHFEDMTLREVTKQIYQIYAFRSATSVYETLKKYGTDYIIVENSACYSANKAGNCSLKEIIDMDPTLSRDNDKLNVTRRLCDEIRVNESRYRNQFILVFENKAFRVYKLIKNIMFL